jgi:hypothetical protein
MVLASVPSGLPLEDMREGAIRFIRVVTPCDGCLLVLAESYFDETNTHRGDDRLCVAGYVFMKDRAEEQAARWFEMLGRWGLPYFHMVDCAHNVGVFERLDKKECDLAAREAIQIIKDTASTGVYVTVLESEYQAIVPQITGIGTAYDALARDVITGVSAWIERNSFEGLMHYHFEDGVDTEAHASWCILQMMQDPDIKRESCYAGHSFVPKAHSPGVQAADLLAWHAGQDCKRAMRGDPIRKDFASLTEIPHAGHHYTPPKLKMIADIINGEIEASGLTPTLLDEIGKLLRHGPRTGKKG